MKRAHSPFLSLAFLAFIAWPASEARANLGVTRALESDYPKISGSSVPQSAPDEGGIDLSSLDSSGGGSSGSAPSKGGGSYGGGGSSYSRSATSVPVFKVYFDFMLYLRPNKGDLTFDSFHQLLLFEILPTPEITFTFEVRQSPRYFELDYQLTPKLKLRLGKIWIPFDDMAPHNIFGGRTNVSALSLGAATFLPDLWADMGVGFKYAVLDTSALQLDLDGYIVNGFRQGGTDPTGATTPYPQFTVPPTSADNNRDKAFGGRAHVTLARKYGLGASYYTGRYNDQGDENGPQSVTAIGFDTQLRFGPLEARAGLATMTVDVGTANETFSRGGAYGEVGYKFGSDRRWKILARGGTVQLDDRALDVTDERIIGGHLIYRIGMMELSFEHSRDLLVRPAKTNYTFTAFRIVVAL